MQRSWLRSFAERHVPMLGWLAGVAIAAVGVTLTLWGANPGATPALLAVPLLLLAGLVAALVDIVRAFRQHHGDTRNIGIAVAGTIGLGIAGLPLTATLAFATIWVADNAVILGGLPTYQRIVADAQHGAIVSSDAWQKRDSVTFMVEEAPGQRIVFRLPDRGYRASGIVYDPKGEVMAPDPADPEDDPHHRIGNTKLHECRATLITAYYRCTFGGCEAV